MAVAGAGAGAEIMDKVGAGVENKSFRLSNTAFKKLHKPSFLRKYETKRTSVQSLLRLF